MAVVTLTINDELVSAQEGESLLSVLRENGHRDPHAVPFGRSERTRRLPPLHGRDGR